MSFVEELTAIANDQKNKADNEYAEKRISEIKELCTTAVNSGERECVIKCAKNDILDTKIQELGFEIEYCHSSCDCHAMDNCYCTSHIEGYIFRW